MNILPLRRYHDDAQKRTTEVVFGKKTSSCATVLHTAHHLSPRISSNCTGAGPSLSLVDILFKKLKERPRQNRKDAYMLDSKGYFEYKYGFVIIYDIT